MHHALFEGAGLGQSLLQRGDLGVHVGEYGGDGGLFFHMFGDRLSRQIDTLLTGSNYPAINSADVRALELPFPEYAEQTAIAAVLSDMDAELATLEQRLDKTRALKQGMMQELLTGRTRLV